MTDGELLALARQKADLTEAAQQAIQFELSQRRLKVEPDEATTPFQTRDPEDDPYAEDRELISIGSVWSQADASQVKALLDRAGIPSLFGPEKSASVEGIKSSFADGLSVYVMRVGAPWVHGALKYYEPLNNPPLSPEDLEERSVKCPKCGSDGVIFEDLVEAPDVTSDSAKKFSWRCDSCGHEWVDDGVVK
jgi:DNA-directed RNA polymerase subunit M/transcription elongation factor TFIIS